MAEKESFNPFSELEITKFKRRNQVPTLADVLWCLIESVISIGSTVGGLLYLSHLLVGWPL